MCDFLIVDNELMEYRGHNAVVEIPEGITKIHPSVFRNMDFITSVTIPASVSSFTVDIVDGCESLLEVVIQNRETTYSGRMDEFCTASIRYADEPPVKVMVIFIGLQGSGKTYYYHSHFAGKYEHVNLDELHTRNKEELLIQQLIADSKNFVIDNTNPQKADRTRYIMLGKKVGYRIVGYFFESKLHDCITRNNQREGKAKIPAKAIAATSNRLQLPSKDEGFDELYFVRRSDEGTMVKSDWRE